MTYESFSSLPPEEERQFVVFEERTLESAAKATRISLAVSGCVLAVTVIIVLSFWGSGTKHAAEDSPNEAEAVEAPR